jgi:hypothetical protein
VFLRARCEICRVARYKFCIARGWQLTTNSYVTINHEFQRYFRPVLMRVTVQPRALWEGKNTNKPASASYVATDCSKYERYAYEYSAFFAKHWKTAGFAMNSSMAFTRISISKRSIVLLGQYLSIDRLQSIRHKRQHGQNPSTNMLVGQMRYENSKIVARLTNDFFVLKRWQ